MASKSFHYEQHRDWSAWTDMDQQTNVPTNCPAFQYYYGDVANVDAIKDKFAPVGISNPWLNYILANPIQPISASNNSKTWNKKVDTKGSQDPGEAYPLFSGADCWGGRIGDREGMFDAGFATTGGYGDSGIVPQTLGTVLRADTRALHTDSLRLQLLFWNNFGESVEPLAWSYPYEFTVHLFYAYKLWGYEFNASDWVINTGNCTYDTTSLNFTMDNELVEVEFPINGQQGSSGYKNAEKSILFTAFNVSWPETFRTNGEWVNSGSTNELLFLESVLQRDGAVVV